MIHIRYAPDPSRPWQGVSSVVKAIDSATLLANVERALGDEASTPTGQLIPTPIAGDDARINDLRAQLAKLRGGALLVETMAGAFGERAAAPKQD